MTGEPPDYLARNRAHWDTIAAEYSEAGRRAWKLEPRWGIWGVPEADLHLLPDLQDKITLEVGCGTGYVSAWLARRGARPYGIDNSPQQLATARALQREHNLHYPLIKGAAERLPFPDAAFDLVISEYGAAIWSDPYRWIPEAARVLKPGGDLIFLVNGGMLMLFVPDEDDRVADDRLKRDYFGMHRMEWPGEDSVEFHLGYGDWIRLLRASGFTVEDLVEMRPPEGATTRYPFVTAEWARRWPSEEIWKARKE